MTPQQQSKSIAQIEAELIDCLLGTPKIEYPWNPAEPDTVDYYTESDRHFSLNECSDAEIDRLVRAFYTQIQLCWADVPILEVN
jgi:hypothetical protein